MTRPDEVVIPGTTMRLLTPATGRCEPYELLLAVPDEEPPAGGFPTLYLLDGGAFFGTLVEMVRLRRNRPLMTAVEPSVVVGIAHPGARPYDRERRQRDYGDAGDDFTRLLRGEVPSMIEREFPVDPGRRVLLGHSLAGYFALRVFLRHPEAFRSYVAVSPSLWCGRGPIGADLATLPQRLPADAPPRRLVVAVGEYDQAIAPWQRAAPDQAALRARREERRMVDEAREFCTAVARTAGSAAEVIFDLREGEDHASVVPVALSRALRLVAGAEPSAAP